MLIPDTWSHIRLVTLGESEQVLHNFSWQPDTRDLRALGRHGLTFFIERNILHSDYCSW